MKSLTQSELNTLVKLENLEVFTPEQLKKYVEDCNDTITKSEGSKAEMYKEVADEMRSFTPYMVWDDDTLEKSIKMVRRAQIEWDEPTDDISKARSGKYTNTPENRKLGRVGKQYGSSKEEDGGYENGQKYPGDHEVVGKDGVDLQIISKIPSERLSRFLSVNWHKTGKPKISNLDKKGKVDLIINVYKDKLLSSKQDYVERLDKEFKDLNLRYLGAKEGDDPERDEEMRGVINRWKEIEQKDIEGIKSNFGQWVSDKVKQYK